MDDQRMTAARFTDLADAYGGDLARWPAASQAPARDFLRRHPRYARDLAAAAALDAALVASRPAPVGPELAAAIRARRAAASAPAPIPLRSPSPARWLAAPGAPPWAAVAAGLVAFVAGALVGASDGSLAGVVDAPDAATWIEASITAAAGDIEWEVLR